MFAFSLALFLTGITRSTGAPSFIDNPEDIIYSKKGSDAVLEWDYLDTTGELNLIIWRVYNKTDKQLKPLLIINQTGDKQPNRNLPPAYVGRVERKGRASLVIKNINFEDSTDFTCSLQTKIAVAATDTKTLVVTGPSSFHPSVEFPEVGGSAIFTCNATGVPNQNFTWMKQGETEKIENNSTHTITCSRTGSCELAIKNVTVGYRGYYVCDATVNPKQTNSAKGYLQVQFPLRQDNTICKKSLFSATMNKSLSICCPVSGYPPPLVTWEKNGAQLQQEENTVLTITSVKDKDLGNYTCTATQSETTIGPFIITVVQTVGKRKIQEKRKLYDLFVSAIDGTVEKPGKLEVQPHAHAENYVVKIEGEGIMTDFLIGTQPSLEVHYHTLVMEKTGEKPPELNICVDVSAMNDKGVIAKAPTCQKLTIKKPSDTEI